MTSLDLLAGLLLTQPEVLLPFFAARAHWWLVLICCLPEPLSSTKLFSAHSMSSQYWFFLVIMAMMQDSVFTILTVYHVFVVSCLSPFTQQSNPPDPFFPFGVIHNPVEGVFYLVSKFFFSQFIPKCTLKCTHDHFFDPMLSALQSCHGAFSRQLSVTADAAIALSLHQELGSLSSCGQQVLLQLSQCVLSGSVYCCRMM